MAFKAKKTSWLSDGVLFIYLINTGLPVYLVRPDLTVESGFVSIPVSSIRFIKYINREINS